MDCRSNPLGGLFGAGAAGDRLQPGVCAIGMERVFGDMNQVAAIADSKLKLARHAHSAVGGGCLALATKDAAAIVHGDLPRAVGVLECDGSSGAGFGRGARIAPGFEVKLRASSKLLGKARRNARITGSRGANAERFLEDLEHRLPICPRVGEVETLVDHRKIRNDVAFDCFHNGWPVVDGWILHLAAFDAIAFAGPDPVNDLTTPPFDGAHRTPARWYGLSWGAKWTLRQKGKRRTYQLDRFAHFIDTDLHSMAHISCLVYRDSEGKLAVRPIRMIAADIAIEI